MTLLILLIGFVSASEVTTDDNSDTTDATVADDMSTVSQSDTTTQENVMEEVKTDESTSKTIRKNSIGNSNLKRDNLITVSSWEELSGNMSALTSESGDTTIRLNEGTYNNTGTITWATSGMVLTIDGNGQTINGQEQQVFYIDNGASLVLKNITITDAKAVQGGAIYNTNSNTTITDSTINSNTAYEIGGAIYNQEGKVNITHTQ